MSFLLKFYCNNCGYQQEDTHNHELIDPLGMPELYICSCNQCLNMFHRKSNTQKKPINKCIYCGSEDIKIHDNIYSIICPSCGKNKLLVDCIGTAF